MGRLPTEFAGARIKFRVPYDMAADLTVLASQQGVQFPEAAFLHNVDKPFEIHRVIPRCFALDSNGSPLTLATQPDEEDLFQMTRLSLRDQGRNEALTKVSSYISALIKGSSERTWEFAEPYTLVKSESLQVIVDNIATNTIVGGTYASTRVSVSFQGFLLVVASPDQR